MGKILVVEDDNDIRDMLGETLGMWQHEPAKHGKEGLEIFSKGGISLILTDMRMPVMDGLTMLKKIRQMDKTVPIIVITGYPSLNSAMESLSCGADFYLVKPINITDLKIKIEKCFQKTGMVRTIARLEKSNKILIWLLAAGFAAGFAAGALFM